MNKRLIDTNLIIRHLVQDHEQHAKAAAKIFAACDQDKLTLILLPQVLAECVFVLESFYRRGRKEIAEVLINLIQSPGIELSDETTNLDALELYGNSKLHFVDCAIAASAAINGIPVATFDNDLKKLPGIRVKLDT